jgi:hypothetical protein
MMSIQTIEVHYSESVDGIVRTRGRRVLKHYQKLAKEGKCKIRYYDTVNMWNGNPYGNNRYKLIYQVKML